MGVFLERDPHLRVLRDALDTTTHDIDHRAVLVGGDRLRLPWSTCCTRWPAA